MGNVAQDLWDSGADLPFLACRAAIELDNLIRGKSKDLKAVSQVIDVLLDVESVLSSFCDTTKGFPVAHLSPNTAVALNFAIADSQFSKASDTLCDLSNQTDQVIQSLKDLIAKPKSFMEEKPEKIKMLKDFCLSLSKRASAGKSSLYKSRHPYRR